MVPLDPKKRAASDSIDTLRLNEAARNVTRRKGRLQTYEIDKIFQDTIEAKGKQQAKPNLTRSRSSSIASNPDTDKAGTHNNDEWKVPRKTNKVPTQGNGADMETENPYSNLQETDGASQQSQTGDNQNNARNNTQNNNKPKSRPPPIFINNTNIDESINKLTNENIDKKLFTIYVNKSNQTIFAKDHDTYDKIKTILINTVEFYTFKKKEDKTINILLKNVAGIFHKQSIAKEIKELNLNQVEITKVKKLPTRKEQEKKKHFIIQISSDSILKNLTDIKKLCCQKIKWEKLRKPKIIQCTRCQRVGHSATTCGMKYRKNLTCANCGEKGHPANYQGCPYLKLANKEKQQETHKPHQPRFINRPRSRPVQLGLQFNQITANQTPQNNTQYPADFPQLPHTNTPLNMPPPPPWANELRASQMAPNNQFQQKQQRQEASSTTLTQNKLKIMAVNVNSIQANKRRLELISRIHQHNPDVILLSETKLKKSHKLTLKNYTIIRTDRTPEKQGGGTAISIRDTIKYEEINYPASINNITTEYTIIKLQNPENPVENITIVSLYATPDNKKAFRDELDSLFISLKLDNTNNSFIIAGDLNTRRTDWGDTLTNERGKYLIKWEKESAPRYQARISTDGPSYNPNNSYLDCCISNLNICDLVNGKITTEEYDSDYKALLFTIQLNHKIQSNQVAKKFNYKATNWSRFTKFLDKNHPPPPPDDKNLTNNDLDEYISTLTKTIQTEIDSTVPHFEKQDSVLKYLNTRIKKLQKNKSKLITDLHRLQRQQPPNYQQKIQNIKSTINLVRDELKKEFDSDLISPDIVQLDKATIDLNRKTATFSNAIDKLNIIGNHYEKINSPRYLNDDTPLRRIIDHTVNQTKVKLDKNERNGTTFTTFTHLNKSSHPNNNLEHQLSFCSSLSIKKILQKLPNKTSSGPDSIPPIVLKHLPDPLIVTLTIIFNNALNNAYFPSAWKEAKVLTILKKNKDPTKPVSYRPISLTSNLGKVYEIHINNIIVKVCEDNKIIPDHNPEYTTMSLSQQFSSTWRKLLIPYGWQDLFIH
ncbi:uncharacterized protein LOC123271737 [Cotesia glomerata]|uniref:uncharacterized protein LOC123271737 n=1 Tax=Cotesia glomerata TaxID=32391 RepID=UPI001D00FDBC|nr:uncharacterized protein LOC123271737 [Cotesia glomerata]